MSSSSSLSARSQPEDFPPEDDANQRPAPNKQLSAGIAEAKLLELAKLYNAEKE